MWVFPIVFDPTKETLLPQVSKVLHLKFTRVFLHGFALLTCSHVFSRLTQTTAEDVYIHVKSLQQKHIPRRKARQKDKQDNLTANAIFNLAFSKNLIKFDDFLFKNEFSQYFYIFSIYLHALFQNTIFLKKAMLPATFFFFFFPELYQGPSITSLSSF